MLIIKLKMITLMITVATMLKVSKMPIIFWQEQGDDDDEVEVWGATADSGSNGFIRGGGEATEGNSWWTHGSEEVATVHKSTNTEIHFYKIHKSTGAPNKVWPIQSASSAQKQTMDTRDTKSVRSWQGCKLFRLYSMSEDSQSQTRCKKVKWG